MSFEVIVCVVDSDLCHFEGFLSQCFGKIPVKNAIFCSAIVPGSN